MDGSKIPIVLMNIKSERQEGDPDHPGGEPVPFAGQAAVEEDLDGKGRQGQQENEEELCQHRRLTLPSRPHPAGRPPVNPTLPVQGVRFIHVH